MSSYENIVFIQAIINQKNQDSIHPSIPDTAFRFP